MKEKIRMGMVGGSKEGFIGNVHRMAAALDGEIELVCGVFSRDSTKSEETARYLGIAEARIYEDTVDMIGRERNLPENQRMDFISVVTPNNFHFVPAQLGMENKFHILCEKPVTFDLNEAEELLKIQEKTGRLFGLMHNYTGYPMVKEAREIVRSGKLGTIRKVVAEYPQGWLSSEIEKSGQRQAGWRTDPTQSGISCAVADIGSHAENLIEYITGLQLLEVAADIRTYVTGRKLEDDASVLLRMESGVTGLIWVSQVAFGEENELKIRIYGENGALEWLQSDPNKLVLTYGSNPKQILTRGSEYLSQQAKVHTRLPSGHPEGFIEAMANVYRNFALAVKAFKLGKPIDKLYDFPLISDGLRGMKFISAVIESGQNNSRWIRVDR